MRLILYSKPGCHLCEGLQEKLEQISSFPLELEVRDITTRSDWFNAYQYEIPVLFYVDSSRNQQHSPDGLNPDISSSEAPDDAVVLTPIPRPSPRATVAHLEQMLQRHIAKNQTNGAQ